ncbi:sugar ABC transporter substrate-binding protein [Clostridium sp. SYSU_GA19001]|uniref:ABC transporter substrate-binding protein n=1 Tax=Clostridium caldaquaticum TaxID=2940653 RepID=UPI002077819C|nr:sugar ABC transporter substrate-binding protein [Clostridium caldaquaticum]MCM8709998.1 sugar ABC transporter substrate-binding protein [Clostridium caldaquaticum]
MRKFTRTFLAVTMVSVMAMGGLTACGKKSGGDSAPASGKEQKQTQLGAETAGANATELSYWTFVDLHGKHFSTMVDSWNKANPNKQIKLNVTVMPYDDMHNKLLIAVQTGQGAPDISDVELGRFPNFLEGENVPLESLDDVIAPFKSTVVPARLEIYSKNGHVYGAPTHVGATVAFYNTEILEKAGVDYKTIKTWDDYKKAGIKVYEKTGKYMGTADTSALWQLSILATEQGADLTDADGKPKVNSPELIKGLEMLKDLQKNNVIATIPGGQPDTEEGKGEFNKGNYASAFMPLWYMSRFTNEMKDLKGKFAIAPLPVFKEGQPRSLGLGGTGTVVTKTAKNVQLAKEFVAYAKLSPEGEVNIWKTLGFDPVNTAIWTDKSITHDPNNEFVQYFKTNPFDVLNEIKGEIKFIKSVKASPTINNVLCTTTLNAIFEDDKDVKEALDEAQKTIEQELK